MSWTVVCPNPRCQQKLTISDQVGDRTQCPFCHQVFAVQKAATQPPVFQEAMLAPSQSNLSTTSKKIQSPWPVWILALVFIETLVTVFSLIVIAIKLNTTTADKPNSPEALLKKASGISNFFFKPHDVNLLDDGAKYSDWSKVYSVKDRSTGSAVSYQVYPEESPDIDDLERAGRAKVARLFPHERFQVQIGKGVAGAQLSGEPAVMLPVDIASVRMNEAADGGADGKLMVGALRVCFRRGIAYWFLTWGPEGSRESQKSWDQSWTFGQDRQDWKPRESAKVLLQSGDSSVRLNPSIWKIDDENALKPEVEARPGIVAHAKGLIQAEKKCHADVFLAPLTGTDLVTTALELQKKWQLTLAGDNGATVDVKLEPLPDTPSFYKLIVNQKTQDVVFLGTAGPKKSHLVIGQFVFDQLPHWQSEFGKISGPQPPSP